MKYICALLAVASLAGCSSLSPKAENLAQSPKCTVWKDGLLGTKTVVEVEGELARQKQTCWIMNQWGCSYTNYMYRGDSSSEIVSSLPPADKTIGNFDGKKLIITMTGLTVDPIVLKDTRADYAIQGPIGPKQSMSVQYNTACTKRQAALGLMTVVSK